MKLLKNGVNLFDSIMDFVNGSKCLFIFVPYIKLESLKAILDRVNNCKAIFVRWETKDLITGASDLEVYDYCKPKGILLFRNKRLHLKAFVDDYKSCIIGSANISGRGLSNSSYSNYNYELATKVENLNIEDRLYFSIIEQESILITDHIYQQIKDQLPIKRSQYPEESDFEIKIEAPDKDFLVSSLPLTYNPETLYRIYESKSVISDIELNCATHDLALYKLNFGMPITLFKEELKKAFFLHPFIIAFLNKLNERGELFFGEAKRWIHENCSDVPLPRRWEITENIQILYKWIISLAPENYAMDKPNHSDRLIIKQPN